MTGVHLSSPSSGTCRSVAAAGHGWRALCCCTLALLLAGGRLLAAGTPSYPVSERRCLALGQGLHELARTIDPMNDAADLRQKTLAAFTVKENCPAEPPTAAITEEKCEQAAREKASAAANAQFQPLTDAALQQEANGRFPLLKLGQTITVRHRLNPVREDTSSGPYRGRTGDIITIGSHKIMVADIIPAEERETLMNKTDATKAEQQRGEYVAARKASFAQERQAFLAEQFKRQLPLEIAAAAQANEQAGYIWFGGAWTPAASVVRALAEQESASLARLYTAAHKPPPIRPAAPEVAGPPTATVPATAVTPVVPLVPPVPATVVTPVTPPPKAAPAVKPGVPETTGTPKTAPPVAPGKPAVVSRQTPAVSVVTTMPAGGSGFPKVAGALFLALVALAAGAWLAYLLAPEKMARSRFFRDRQEAQQDFWGPCDASGGKIPHVACQFPGYGAAFRALAQLSYLDQKTADRPLWSPSPIQLGIYQHDHVFVAFVGGARLTRAMWNEAVACLAKAEGAAPFRISAPPALRVVLPDLRTKPTLAGKVQSVRQYTGERGDFAEYLVFTAPDKATANAFLKLVKVADPDVHLVVETPAGNWGRDVRGVYRE